MGYHSWNLIIPKVLDGLYRPHIELPHLENTEKDLGVFAGGSDNSIKFLLTFARQISSHTLPLLQLQCYAQRFSPLHLNGSSRFWLHFVTEKGTFCQNKRVLWNKRKNVLKKRHPSMSWCLAWFFVVVLVFWQLAAKIQSVQSNVAGLYIEFLKWCVTLIRKQADF